MTPVVRALALRRGVWALPYRITRAERTLVIERGAAGALFELSFALRGPERATGQLTRAPPRGLAPAPGRA